MSAIATHARLGWLRLRRGRALWLSLALFALPLLGAGGLAARGSGGHDLFHNMLEIYVALLIPLAALLTCSGAIADEIDSRGVSFLLVRPAPRGALLVGKLLAALLPLAIALAACVAAVFTISTVHGSLSLLDLLRALLGACLALFAFGAASATLGVFAPRHPVLATVAWFLVVEAGLGGAPVAACLLSVSWHVRNLADLGHPTPLAVPPLASAAVAAAVGALWLAVGAARLSRSEFP